MRLLMLLMIIFLGLIIISCKKESDKVISNENDTNIVDTNNVDTLIKKDYKYLNYIIAGNIDSLSVILNVLNPQICLTNNFGDYSMLNLDNDSLNDLLVGVRGEYFEIPDCPCDSGVICDCWPNPYIQKYLQTFEKLEIAISKKDGYNSVQPLNKNDTIDDRLDWINDNYSHTLIYNSPTNNYGNWTDSLDKFAGFRIRNVNDTIYGWIRINVQLGIRINDYATNRIKRN